MQPFRIHGLAGPESAPRRIPAFGRPPIARYGRAAVPRAQPVPAAEPAPVDDDLFPWVDQEFEEYFFE